MAAAKDIQTTAVVQDKAIAGPIHVSDQIEKVLIGGDLAALNPDQRVQYHKAVCESLGLNPLTRPFEYITLNNKLTLYARKDCTDQLRRVHNLSVIIAAREIKSDCYIVTARVSTPAGRTDESTGAVALGTLKGDSLANAFMKAETKAKRRATLSICGLGFTDESEVESIPGARAVVEEAPPATIVEKDEKPVKVQLMAAVAQWAGVPSNSPDFRAACADVIKWYNPDLSPPLNDADSRKVLQAVRDQISDGADFVAAMNLAKKKVVEHV